jgi:hypothetical protein
MKEKYVSFVFILMSFWCHSQNDISDYLDYKPAPGQHINIQTTGTHPAAQKMIEEYSSLVSLGSFGGYIILKFENACVNDPENPYGIDFTVYGNSFTGSSEPGVIWVMTDQNGNGLADDTWYEIAGSRHFHSSTLRNHEVTYFRTDSRDIYWKDNHGNSGYIVANSYHTQDYYPSEENFPQYPQDSVKFAGTMLQIEADSSDAQWKTIPPVFGYADCHPLKQGVDLSLPDNPYTETLEGAGGDPVDIAWAVDTAGNYVDPDSVHFVKIVSANMASAGWLGEISTDVAWIEDVDPHPEITGTEKILVVYPHEEKILTGDSLLIEAIYFEKGKKTDISLTFYSKNSHVLSAESSGMLRANNVGEAEIVISGGGETKSVFVNVIIPDSIEIITDLSSVYAGDSLTLTAQVYDNYGTKIDMPVIFSSSNSTVGEVVGNDGIFTYIAHQPGEAVLRCSVEKFSVYAETKVNVFSPSEKVNIFFSLKTEEENLLPFQWIEVSRINPDNFVENRQSSYSGTERPVLFHALVAGLSKAGVNYIFRDDESANNNLYLYSVENNGLFKYGWGGKADPVQYAKAWIARLNGNQFLNCFDDVEISDGDTVDLYHISDITCTWNYSRLLADKDTGKVNEVIELILEQTECNYSGSEITEKGFVPLKNTEIISSDGKSYLTDDNGVVNVNLGPEPPFIYSAANNAVLINGTTATYLSPVSISNFDIYPNPVTDILTIKCESRSLHSYKLCDIYGRTVIDSNISGSLHKANLSMLDPGIYLLILYSDDNAITRKIIRQ